MRRATERLVRRAPFGERRGHGGRERVEPIDSLFLIRNPEAERKRGLSNKKVANRKLRLELGYQFKYPTFREGYSAVDFIPRETKSSR